MLDQDLEQQAALYACGAMDAQERERFELVLEFHEELKTLTRELQEIMASAVVAGGSRAQNIPRPSPGLKARLMARIDAGVPQAQRLGFVVSGPDGLVRWVNEEFTAMCGYSLEELRGRKLGPILQGQLTAPEAVDFLRAAVNARKPCQAELINYHKDGTPYWVAIEITPIMDEQGETRWLVARERELHDRPLPVAA
ncbi:MAG: PAS domain-containing protein [Verrucomicrobiaceae bacterium]|nr:MAG: PAS domain-containing protein [Verrucomicrobiaceae bacterium]